MEAARTGVTPADLARENAELRVRLEQAEEALRRGEQRLSATEREAREESARARGRDELLESVSHRLRTPLNAILGWAQLLRRDPARADRVSEGAEVIERNARLQARLVSDLLDVSRLLSGTLRLDLWPVELAPVLEAAVAAVQQASDAKGVRIESALEKGIELARGDAGRLEQVLRNLLSNAIQATPAGGSVRVALARRDASAEIVVSDTGKGIAAERLPSLFDGFRGAGPETAVAHGEFGLPIVRGLVELHGGSVRASSGGPGQGATFVVQLPLAPP
jgi:signal transduction histidine kinase